MRSTAKREEEAAASKGSGSNKPHKQKGQRTFLTKKNGIKTQKHEKLSTTKTMRERERKKRRERTRASHSAANEREESAKKVRRESDRSKRAAQQAVKFKRARASGRESRRVQLEIKCQNLCDVHFVKYFYENNLRKMYF